jgi:hypothetical protein
MAIGQFFTVDALIAMTVMLGTIVLIASATTPDDQPFREHVLANDLIRSLSAISVEESNAPLLIELRNNGTIQPQQMNRSLLEYTSELWSTGNITLAQLILTNVSEHVSEMSGFSLLINDEQIYTNSASTPTAISRTTRLISGINKSQPVRGYSARMQFSASSNRTTSTFAYFGGFSGQGDVELSLRDLPSDINTSRIVSFSMEAAISQDVEISVNGVSCGVFVAQPAHKESQYFSLSSCAGAVVPGDNTVRLSFNDLDTAFVGGGFVRIRYTTDEISIPPPGQGIYHFPDIDGIINIYDSFTIPGNLTSLTIHLEYDAIIPSNVSTTYYLTIGNTTVYNGTNITSESITLTDGDLTMLDYARMNGTIPIRMGLEGVNYTGYITIDRPSDTVLVTDVSGSMTACGDTALPLTCTYGCSYRWLFWTFQTSKSCSVGSIPACTDDVCGGSPTCINTYDHDACRARIDVAIEAAKVAADGILQSDLAQVGTVSYSTGTQSVLDLTDDISAIESEIDSYTAGGWTCICCGIYRAFDLYTNFSDNHSYMVVLSDGDATYDCTGPGDYSGSSASQAAASQATIDAGQYACANNVSVFTIAIGDDLTPTGIDTLRQTACEDSMFFSSDNFSDLQGFYETVTQEILSRTTYTSQIVNPGEGMASNLTNSYISFEYDPIAQPPMINEVPITVQTPTFTLCTDDFLLGTNLRVVEAFVTSYSDEHWTSLVGINGDTVFDISRYGSDYTQIGDPFVVGLPADRFANSVNTIALLTGSEPGNETGCSVNNSIVIKAAVAIDPAVSIVTPKAEGCHWHVMQEDLNVYEITIPTTYNGTKECYYESATYDDDDAYDRAAYELFRQLDVTNSGRIDIYLREQELSVEVAVTQDVPSLWGPSEYVVEVSR